MSFSVETNRILVISLDTLVVDKLMCQQFDLCAKQNAEHEKARQMSTSYHTNAYLKFQVDCPVVFPTMNPIKKFLVILIMLFEAHKFRIMEAQNFFCDIICTKKDIKCLLHCNYKLWITLEAQKRSIDHNHEAHN